MLFYLLAKYRQAARFEDFVYLTQLVQANTIRFATDCWRRRIGRQNGALFWQLNDCWPVASWAGIDYGKQLKAVMYQARHFNKMLCLSNDYYQDRAELYVTNEYPQPFAGTLTWELRDFSGAAISGGGQDLAVDAVASKRVAVLPFDRCLKGHKKDDAVLTVRLAQGGALLDEKHWLLVPDRAARLPKTRLTVTCTDKSAGGATVRLAADSYARYVYLEADGVTAPWSDNFFDIPAGRSVEVTVALPQGMDAAGLSKALRVKTLADVRPKSGRLADRWLKAKMFMSNKNFVYWILFKVIFG
jgi:beta-mannosidase